MAFITLAGTLRDPTSELAVGDQIRFTHKSTTGETVEGAVSILTIDPSGTYSKDLQYGLVLVEYKDVRRSQFENLGIATVNGSNPATSIPELLNALVPVSSAELIEFQAILADCITAKDAAEAAAATLDLINDMSQAYIFNTVAEYKASAITFPAGKTIHLNDRDADFKVISGTGTATEFKIIANSAINQSVSLVEDDRTITAKEFGASINDNDLQELLDTGKGIIVLSGGNYSSITEKIVSTSTAKVIAPIDALNLDSSLFDKRIYRDGIDNKRDLSVITDKLTSPSNDFIYINEGGNADRFYVLTPSGSDQYRNKFRFDRSEGNFDDGGAEAGNRPYLLTQINRDKITTLNDYSLEDDGVIIGTWIVSGSNKYSETTGDKAKFSFYGDELSLLYGRGTNNGIANIFIDGKPANIQPNLDMYGAAGSVRVTVADNLGFTDHKLEIVVSGNKDASSSGFRVPINRTQAYRTIDALPTKIFTGQESDFVSFTDTQIVSYKNIGSAVTYALGFRLASNSAANTPFIGSVHGYEELQTIKVYLDGVEQLDWLSGAGGYENLRSGREVIVEHITKLVHPDDTGYFADITLTEVFTSKGYLQSYSIKWLQDITFSNGYSQMWVANGGIQGGVPADVNGWCDHVRFNTGQNKLLNSGDSSDHFHDFPSQVVMYGSPLDATYPLREAESGNIAMMLSFPDLEKSFDNFKGEQSRIDGVWAQDRNTIKKIYVQPFRTPNKNWIAGESMKGSLAVDIIYSNNNGAWKAFKN